MVRQPPKFAVRPVFLVSNPEARHYGLAVRGAHGVGVRPAGGGRNRSGAAGTVGAEAVARARPDGTTHDGIGMTTLCAYKALYARLPFDPTATSPRAARRAPDSGLRGQP